MDGFLTQRRFAPASRKPFTRFLYRPAYELTHLLGATTHGQVCSGNRSGLKRPVSKGGWPLSHHTGRGGRMAEGTFATGANGFQAMFDAMAGRVQGAQKRTITKNP